MFLFGPAGLAKFTRDSPAVSDDTPYTEFPLWRWFQRDNPLTDDHVRREFADRIGDKSPAPESTPPKM